MFDILVISPYTDDDPVVEFERLEQTEKYVASLVKQGFIVYSTITAMLHIVTKYDIPSDYSYWQKHCRRMVEMSDRIHVLMLDGWEESQGVADEVFTATDAGKSITMIPLINIPSVQEIE